MRSRSPHTFNFGRSSVREIASTMNGVDAERRVPPLWLQFDALRAKPLMVIRGANSDLLTGETVEAMRARRKVMDVIEVPDQGHAPLLTDAATIGRISEFVHRCERSIHPAPRAHHPPQ